MEEPELLPAMQPVEAEAAMQLHAIVGYRNTVQAQGLLVNRSAKSIATQDTSIIIHHRQPNAPAWEEPRLSHL